MNYEEYLTMSCIWQKNLGIDEDTMMQSFDDKKEIKCFSYGKNIFLRENTSSTTVSAKAYIVTEEVKVKDIIDGQVVKSVDNIPEFDGSIPLYICLTWND